MKINSVLLLIIILLLGGLLFQEKSLFIKDQTSENKRPYQYNRYLKNLDRFERNVGKNINVPTRGFPDEYQAVGFVTDIESKDIQQLYGRKTYPNADMWNYYVLSDDYHQIPIPLKYREKDCTDLRGCQELYTNDEINLNGNENDVTMYNLEPIYRI